MSSKSSALNLYAQDDTAVKAFHVTTDTTKVSVSTPTPLFELSAPKFKLCGQTDVTHDIPDLGLYLKTLSTVQSSDKAVLETVIATNTTDIAALTNTVTANAATAAAAVATETTRASTAESTLQTNINTEIQNRTDSLGVVVADVIHKHNTVTGSLAAEVARAEAAETANADAIAALQVIDANTLASINSMLSAYQSADNSLSNLVAGLTTRITTLEGVVDTLLQEP